MPPPSRSKTRLLLVAAALAVLVAAGVVVTVVVRGDDGACASEGGDGSRCVPPPSPEPTDPWGIALGPLDAEHEVIVYEDFLCTACASFDAAAGEQLRAMAEAGDLRLVVRPVAYLVEYGDFTERAMNALFTTRDIAGDGAAFSLNAALLADQPAVTGPFPGDGRLLAQSVAAGAVRADARAAIATGNRQNLVREVTDRAIDREGITSVPLVLLDRVRFAEGEDAVVIARRLLDALA